MKKITVFFVLMVVSVASARAQQRPQYTQYIFNNFLLNPAIAGIENYADVKVGHRSQWAGIKDAPKTTFVASHWNLGADYLWSNPLSLPDIGGDPMGRNYMQHYMASPSHHGMGFVAVSDKAGPIGRVDVGLDYAYHLKISDRGNLAVGVHAGVSKVSINADAILFDQPSDPALSNLLAGKMKPDLSLGFWYYGARYFVGGSMQQVIPQKFQLTKNSPVDGSVFVPHYFFTAGYKFYLDDEISAISSVMLKKVNPIQLSADANLKVSFKDKIWLGGSYRNKDSFAGMFGINIKNFANLTYAYDLTTSSLNRVNNGSHEIVLGFQLSNKYEVWSTGRMR